MANWKGTLVPNSGYVENIYFNTSLSVEEVVNIIENANLTYETETFGGVPIYWVFSNDTSAIIYILSMNGIYTITNMIDNITLFSNVEDTANNIAKGWNPDFNGVIEVNAENVDMYAPAGTQNEALKNLFSSTPFTSGEETTADKLQKLIDNKQVIVDSVNAKAGTSYDIHSKPSDIANTITNIETGGSGTDTSDATATPNDILKGKTAYTAEGKVEGTIETYNGSMTEGAEQTGLPLEVDSLPSSGTAVPNSGMVEKVYINTALSVEEVVSLLSQLTYNEEGRYVLLVDSNNTKAIMLLGMDGMYAINVDGAFVWSNTEQLGFIGWSSDFANSYSFNLEATSILGPYSVGIQNDLVKDLFSITPFGGSAGVEGAIYKVGSEPAAVPTSGMVENIYFNTKMLPSNILDTLSKLTYISGVPFGFPDYVDVAVIFITSDLNSLVLVERINQGDVGYRYELGHLVDQSTFNNIWTSASASDNIDGWYTNYSYNPLVVNNENALNILSTQSGLVVQNEAVKDLISTTNFDNTGYYLCENGSFTKLVKEK